MTPEPESPVAATRFRDTSHQDRPVAAPRRRWLLPAVVSVVVIALLVAWLGPKLGQGFSADSSVRLSRLGIAAVELGPLVRDVAGEGKVVAAQSPTLYAATAGAVTLKVREGDPVRLGQVIALIDSPELANKLAQERSQIDALRADVARAEVEARQQAAALQSAFENARIDQQTAVNDLARQTQAFEAGASPRMQVERAQDALAKARLALDQARGLLGLKTDSLALDVRAKQSALARQQLLVQDLERQVGELSVRSPVDGQVGQLFVAERANVARDAKLASVIDLSRLEVQMQVAESYARELQAGMPGEITGNGQKWAGIVGSISPEVVGGEVAARLRFAGAQPEQLRQNQRLSVRVLLDRRERVLTLRRGSFVDESGGKFAYVLRDGMAQRVPVQLGVRGIDKVEVLGGLKVGDQVVVQGADAFKGVERVRVIQ